MLTVGNISDLTQDVVSAYLLVALRWADQCLADHGNIDFGTNAPVCGLKGKENDVNANIPRATKESLRS